MMAVWSYLRQFMYTKWVIVVDDDIDARDWKDVMWAISTRMDPARDITMIENTPIDYLDFASPESGLGSKIGLDATNKWPPETKREWGREIRMSDEIVQTVTEKWPSSGFPAPAHRSGNKGKSPAARILSRLRLLPDDDCRRRMARLIVERRFLARGPHACDASTHSCLPRCCSRR